MAKLTRSEVIRDYGKSTAHISTYLSRGKLYQDDDGMFDTENEINKDTFEKWEKDLQEKKQQPKNSAPSSTRKTTGKQGELDFVGDKKKQEQLTERFRIETRNKELTSSIKVEQLEIQRMQRMRLQGQLIPTELVAKTFTIHLKNVSDTMYNAAEDIATNMVKKFGGTREDIITIRQMMIKKINAAIEDAKVRSKKELKQIIIDSSANIKS